MKPVKTLLLALPLLAAGCSPDNGTAKIRPLEAGTVTVEDTFWSPRFEKWEHVTVGDMLDKFEGNDPAHFACGVDAFENFDLVASGARNIGRHAGPPWYDGLVYETIRGIADLLALRPDSALKARVDGYIARIEAAQQSDSDGFLGTHTQLTEDSHRWGANGGWLRMQHDVYNAGMLVEAGVHYYKATGDARLLRIATRFADYMVRIMGPSPKKNIVPAHSGPEEALVKLYRLYRDEPQLREQTGAQSAAGDYLALAEFWIGNRGVHCGQPLWGTWGNDSAERWIHKNLYTAQFGPDARPTWGDYAQDSIRVFEQPAIVGHAVRATLLATGIAAAACENGDERYIATAKRWWDDMAGRKLFLTGGVGAVHFDEKFGHDYFLPTDAYLETCAAVGVGFFSQRMNSLTGDAKYMDEFERALYNNVLAGVSASGDRYTYQNPLNTDRSERWEWHPCPCCPPMFLKIVSATPGFIYAEDGKSLYVNLFIGSRTDIALGGTRINVRQQTGYPANGQVDLTLTPDKASRFAVRIRIPGWARGEENPFGLYVSESNGKPQLSVNGTPAEIRLDRGYAVIERRWQPGDRISLQLPVAPRVIRAHEQARELDGKVALAAGPFVYCIEQADNADYDRIELDTAGGMRLEYRSDLMGGTPVITGTAHTEEGVQTRFTAIPYHAFGNRGSGGYRVWLPALR